MSTYRRGYPGSAFTPLGFHLVPADKFHEQHSRLNMLCTLGLGSVLTIAITAFMLWLLADRRPVLLWFSALCLAATILVTVATAPFTWNFPASWRYWMRIARLVVSGVVGGLLFGTAFLHFNPSRPRWLIALLVIAAVGVWGAVATGGLLFVMWRVAFGATLIVAAAAIWRRREGAWWVAAGVVTTALLFERDPMHFDKTEFAFSFLPVLVGLIAAIALQVRRERLEARDAKLTAARLEIELLRKNLQPHFMLNTLTALAQFLEEKPAVAVRLIEDLAAEFRALTRLSAAKLVPLAEELALCRAHLRVISARTERAWSLETVGIDLSAAVPPALFLTLIENGFSHQRAQDGDTTFRLGVDRGNDGIRYTFLSPGAIRADPSRAGGGMGLRYVRSRLDESFHGAWTLAQRETPGGWETVIELKPGAGARAIA
ncbi:MAG: histidine kinase [Opitutaceae bacterium]|nr:histidine kinase [Opitutaceae bacterium]